MMFSRLQICTACVYVAHLRTAHLAKLVCHTGSEGAEDSEEYSALLQQVCCIMFQQS